ncbi:MAG: hypothetical protein PHR77_22135 [Kiritimatiellae bacterium]|nr:hypothetical protein [Kiritimatiellia bacterium]MDD5520441.1 hypothetical protein [Kiritimatiellia bacterium]
MNIDPILESFNRQKVSYLLIGGMNFHLRHKPILTYDIDFWVEDTNENLLRCEKALAELNAEWGKAQEDWGPVANLKPGWLKDQEICLTSPFCPINIYRSRKGVGAWGTANERAYSGTTPGGVSYRGLGDEDTLADQYALDEQDRRMERIRILEEILGKKPSSGR